MEKKEAFRCTVKRALARIVEEKWKLGATSLYGLKSWELNSCLDYTLSSRVGN